MAVVEVARAKVNLDLHVTGRRPDGYHELDSLVVFAAGLYDRLTLRRRPGGLSLTLAGPFAAALAGETDNLVLRAARRLAERAGVPAEAALELDKRIPIAAGLGGGSADAAAALRGLNRLWGLGLGRAELAEVAGGLGADVAVCLASAPARMTGIGERLAPPAAPLPPDLPLLLVNPGVPVPTGAVFRGLDGDALAAAPDGPVPASAADPTALAGWLRGRRNDLEPPARRLAPAIGDALALLADRPGCLLARLSGSGATCFGLFADRDRLAAAADAVRRDRPGWWVQADLA
ncbi:MAG TPA: 4-(cytidine 5'-diphospho)-2-C-methyl-D-erythritol kinase [Geminicoccaceae bacterium]|nr:4-(cytidine 5'-diphospho)-2-C-methyl-D-erythritol kinase [Geminicoccaceae bacterium]